MKPIDFLIKATETKDGNLVEDALYSDLSNDYDSLKILIEIFDQDWHHSHEDIALTFQKSKSKSAVGALFRVATMKFEYLEYNDSEALSRKCTWALADIGTNEAKEALSHISKNATATIAGFAQKRLGNWQQELSRKGK